MHEMIQLSHPFVFISYRLNFSAKREFIVIKNADIYDNVREKIF
jgi:hypothetical protein